jgi:protein-S-isoprenylcysteine O-methyltransferase Ste14
MSEIPKIPWGKVISNFIWILGAAIILADFSYHEFLASVQKTKRIEVFKRSSFKRPLLIGLILVTAGISVSIHNLWLAIIFGVVSVLLIILLFKFIRA